jgi:phenylpropionate dioxygenase-like ring-hydroxylating dioxygenase large terminal subunit
VRKEDIHSSNTETQRPPGESFLKNSWYAAAWAHEIEQKPFPTVLLNEPVVLFRASDGTPVALQDRCPHRRVPLSAGKIVDDAIQCPYHGMRFNGQGRCIFAPAQERIPSAAHIRSYPVVERHTLIWIWMGDPALANDGLIPTEVVSTLDDPDWRHKGQRRYLKCSYRLLIDNLTDMLHLAYVHTSTIGNPAIEKSAGNMKLDRGDNFVRVERWMIDQAPPPGFVSAGGFTGNIDRWHVSNFVPPSYFRLDLGAAPAGTGAPQGKIDPATAMIRHNINCITPETETTCHYFWAESNRSWRRDPTITERIYAIVLEAFEEDTEILELQQRTINFDPSAPELHLSVDAPGIQVRKILKHRIDEELAASSSQLQASSD